MKDINGKEVLPGLTIEDSDGKKYLIVENDTELYAKSLFDDAGCGLYILHQERIIRNGFKIIE